MHPACRPLIQTYDIRTRFFDQVNLAYYPLDDFEAAMLATAISAASTPWR